MSRSLAIWSSISCKNPAVIASCRQSMNDSSVSSRNTRRFLIAFSDMSMGI